MKNKDLALFAKYTSLNVIGMIGMSVYILADTFFIANGVGANGLTALNLALPIFNIVNGTGLMLAMGGATKYNVCKSRGDACGMDARTDSEIPLLHSGRSLRIKILPRLDRIKSGTGAASAVSVSYIRRR